MFFQCRGGGEGGFSMNFNIFMTELPTILLKAEQST